MARLKSREMFPPGQFQALWAETGQASPFVGSFNAVCLQSLQLIKGNPFLASKHGWIADMAWVEQAVEAQNVARCLAGGWSQWIESEAPAPIVVPWEAQKKTGLLRSAAAGVSQIKAGIGLLLDWLGEGGQPVADALANSRAAVCAGCPKNQPGDWMARFTKPIAEKIRTQLEIRNELQLKTPSDGKLGICDACDCPLRLKVHTPMAYIAKHTSEETKTRLDPRCWILRETL